MKKDFPTRPETISEQYCEAVGGFSWYDFDSHAFVSIRCNRLEI